MRSHHTLMFFSLYFSFPSPLSKNKEVKSLKKNNFIYTGNYRKLLRVPEERLRKDLRRQLRLHIGLVLGTDMAHKPSLKKQNKGKQ